VRGAVAVGAALLALLPLGAGCGDGDEKGEPQPTSAPPSTPAALEVPIRDAVAARDLLVRSALDGVTTVDPTDALVERYPEVRFGSSEIDADPRGVSTWWTPQDPYAAESPGNPTLYVVAVLDSEGRCAVGMATGVGTFDDGVIADDAPRTCTAEAALGPLGVDRG
jgi:hypothetical protein